MVGAADKRRGGERQRGESICSQPLTACESGHHERCFRPLPHSDAHIVTDIHPLSIDTNATSSPSPPSPPLLYLLSGCNPFS